ncbi:unnamed protein product [Didymodactylos carnosus]|uniref:Uncharacterized protein n=1 Tax=Didymodactylos carnosus TaxID=1234261 RepID=A0A8S2FLC1_9BILA|nr:unnamed protein product [Didymodactylos carnosus]CAF4291513.1 unnamed protein product [Didymodactylos carnosus]
MCTYTMQENALETLYKDMKIRLYLVDDRQNLRNVRNPQWNDAYQKYLQDLKYPYNDINDRAIISDWLIGLAIRLEFGDNSTFSAEMQNLPLLSRGSDLD